MLIKYLLKKYKPEDFCFVKYENKEGCDVHSLVLRISDLDAYDILNKEKISNFGFIYKKALEEYIVINEKEISLRKAKKLAKPFLKKFHFYCEEQEDIKHPNQNKLMDKVQLNKSSKEDIII